MNLLQIGLDEEPEVKPSSVVEGLVLLSLALLHAKEGIPSMEWILGGPETRLWMA
jgi:hypothetical protein